MIGSSQLQWLGRRERIDGMVMTGVGVRPGGPPELITPVGVARADVVLTRHSSRPLSNGRCMAAIPRRAAASEH
jgi:hypothetical protein